MKTTRGLIIIMPVQLFLSLRSPRSIRFDKTKIISRSSLSVDPGLFNLCSCKGAHKKRWCLQHRTVAIAKRIETEQTARAPYVTREEQTMISQRYKEEKILKEKIQLSCGHRKETAGLSLKRSREPHEMNVLREI